MSSHLRPARPDDVDIAVPLIYSSGPDAFEYVFADPARGGAQVFLRMAFLDGSGEFGYQRHTVAEVDGEVVGIGIDYSGSVTAGFTMIAARQIMKCYSWSAPGIMIRGLRTERVIPPPKRTMQYIGHLGVDPRFRGQGIGTRLVEAFIDRARRAGMRTAELDVSVENRAAERLYERLGFRVTAERRSTLSNQHGFVANHRRMAYEL